MIKPFNQLQQLSHERWLSNIPHEPLLQLEELQTIADLDKVPDPSQGLYSGDKAKDFLDRIPLRKGEDILIVEVRRQAETLHIPLRRRQNRMLPSLNLLTEIPQTDLPKVYRSVDALLAPSRGEGWGRPHSEAMAMGLPVVATNWSGPTEFMNSSNSFLLPYTHLAPIRQGAFQGHYQAEPCAASMARLMHQIIHDPTSASRIGLQAEKTMRETFSPSKILEILNKHLLRILQKLQTDNRGEL